jgi:hypothetical protein
MQGPHNAADGHGWFTENSSDLRKVKGFVKRINSQHTVMPVGTVLKVWKYKKTAMRRNIPQTPRHPHLDHGLPDA